MTVKNTNGKRITGKQVFGRIALLVGLFIAVMFVSFEVLQLDQAQNKAAAGWVIAGMLAFAIAVSVIVIRRIGRR